MIRALAIFLVLFAAAAATLSLLPNPPEALAPRSAVAAPSQQEAASVESGSRVRVVYPAYGSDNPRGRVLATSDSGATAKVEVALTVEPAVAVYPQIRGADASSTAGVPEPNAAAQAGTTGVNLNTASIDALNQIPGAGRIGRTIASHRPYRSVADLLTKRVVKKSVYDRIKDQVAAE